MRITGQRSVADPGSIGPGPRTVVRRPGRGSSRATRVTSTTGRGGRLTRSLGGGRPRGRRVARPDELQLARRQPPRRQGSWPLAEQDRSRRTRLVADGSSLRDGRRVHRAGECHARSGAPGPHAGNPRVEDTDRVQIAEWYDGGSGSPTRRSCGSTGRSPSVRRRVGGRRVGGAWPRSTSTSRTDDVDAHLHEKNGELELAALIAAAARSRTEPRRTGPPDATSGPPQPAASTSASERPALRPSTVTNARPGSGVRYRPGGGDVSGAAAGRLVRRLRSPPSRRRPG